MNIHIKHFYGAWIHNRKNGLSLWKAFVDAIKVVKRCWLCVDAEGE